MAEPISKKLELGLQTLRTPCFQLRITQLLVLCGHSKTKNAGELTVFLSHQNHDQNIHIELPSLLRIMFATNLNNCTLMLVLMISFESSLIDT